MDEFATDRELFQGMSGEDSWIDGRLHEVVLYLASNRYLQIPDSWNECMTAYLKQLREQAPNPIYNE